MSRDSNAIRRVGEALVARHEEIARAMVARIAAEIPEYGRGGDELRADVLVLATATAELLARTVATGVPLGREYVPIVREQAARRVHMGVSLDDFLHAYRTALFEYWDACTAEADRHRLSRAAGMILGRAAIDAMDTLTTHAAEAYLREESRVRAQSGREARDLVERLIRGQPVGDGRRHPAAPGLDPTGILVTVVGRIEATSISVGHALQVARDSLKAGMSLGKVRPLLAIRDGEIVAVARANTQAVRLRAVAAAREQVLDEHAVDVRYGVSFPSPGFPSVQQAYREATRSLSYTSAQRPIVSLADLSSLEIALVGASAETKAVIASKGAAVAELAEAEVATVRAFADADLNVARAAEELVVHPNTVRYRLERIAELTGHDPRTFAGLVELLCVLETTADEPPVAATV